MKVNEVLSLPQGACSLVEKIRKAFLTVPARLCYMSGENGDMVS